MNNDTDNNPRANILANIRLALQTPPENQIAKPDFNQNIKKTQTEQILEVQFAQNFQKNGGEFYFCQTLEDFLMSFKFWCNKRKIKHLFAPDNYLQTLLKIALIDFEIQESNFELADACLLLPKVLLAEEGSLLFVSENPDQRKWSVFPPVLVVMAFSTEIIANLESAFKSLEQQYQETLLPNMVSIISPSSSCELIVFLVEEM